VEKIFALINQMEAALCGARVFLVNGLITDCGRLVREGDAVFSKRCRQVSHPGLDPSGGDVRLRRRPVGAVQRSL
jgi:hypothetical protein